MDPNKSYVDFFRQAGGVLADPHGWQTELAFASDCQDRLIRIPTGFGKTLGALTAWLWNRVERSDGNWPTRLVWCLPMRTLVEQTHAEACLLLGRLGRLWDGQSDHAGKVGVHILMGGAEAGEWHLHPEHPAILIGTQDMLLSRALNRGYGSPRARWPMEFGLINQDCLWVMDEVQLMDVGLATSAQLQAFRGDDDRDGKTLRPCRTWWMSATLQPAWLQRSPDTLALCKDLEDRTIRIAPTERKGTLWTDVRKRCELVPMADVEALARRIAMRHGACGYGASGPTLVVVNTVRTAVALHALLARESSLRETDLKLVHSRFRPAERSQWREQFLNRSACSPGTNRIIIATQVIEAGVDLSAGLLITELAPWASLVQRFGRAARWGGSAEIEVIDFQHMKDKDALPYALEELDAARAALRDLDEVAPLQLEAFEDAHPELLPRLYPYNPRHLLLRHEVEELFDTTPDLSGADIDISRFIRSGAERDVQVFWEPIEADTKPEPSHHATRQALCSVPFLDARNWLFGKEPARKLAPGKRAWVWDYLDGEWRVAERGDLYPGQTVMVSADSGGYRPNTGWVPESKEPVVAVAAEAPSMGDQADAREDDESLSNIPQWQTIAVHGAQVGREVARIAVSVDLPLAALLDLAGRWHDAGKALAPFQASIVGGNRPARQDLAKAPSEAWCPANKLYPDPPAGRRIGFRHELASTLALFELLARHHPDHSGLLGPWRTLLRLAGHVPAARQSTDTARPNALEQEVLALSAEQFDLLAYLVCSHHGKVRMAWHAAPADQKAADSVLRLRGIREGDSLPAITLATTDGSFATLPACELHLDAAAAGLNPRTGRGWTERVLGLIGRHGPFALAYLEALLRAADQRASRNPVADPLLQTDNADHGLETRHRELAQAVARGEGSSAMGADTAERGAEHGLRGRAGESGSAGSGTRTPDHATRFLETTQGRLSYAQLAPLLAQHVAEVELAIEAGEFDDRSLDESLILELHRRVCARLVPQFAGWRRVDVIISAHTPPAYFKVPEALRAFVLDLAERQLHIGNSGDALLDLLAFAEGRLLSIHPFVDFNGRATRLFLKLLLRRFDLPVVDLAASAAETPAYLAALAAADHHDWKPLRDIWQSRFAHEGRQ